MWSTAPKARPSAVQSDRACSTDAEVVLNLLGNELGLLEGALARSRERVRSFKQERKGQRELIGQTLQMALAGCQGRVLELESELRGVRLDAAERIAQLEQELTRDRRVRASDLGKDDDGTLSIGSLGSGKPGGALSLRAPPGHSPVSKRAGSESRRIAELENELQAMHVKVQVQHKEIESLRDAEPPPNGAAGPEGGGSGRLAGVPLRDIENAIHVQQREYKAMIEELENHARLLGGGLAEARAELGAKDGLIAAVEHEADAARSQLLQAEGALERRSGDVAQLTSQLQLCILELKTLSEKSREVHGKQRAVFDGARNGAGGRAQRLLQHSGVELERRSAGSPATPTALAADL